MITISVRRNTDGSYTGLTESDRWNLETLATPYANCVPFRGNLDILSTGTPSKLANYRKALAKLGFKLEVERAPARKPTVVVA